MYYSYHPSYYYPQYGRTAYWPIRQFPNVDPTVLHQSANETKKLMQEASLVLDKLADSKEFDTKLMNAAQASNKEEVTRLIHSLGVTSNVNVRYTPDGFNLEFTSKVANVECCRLIVALRWN